LHSRQTQRATISASSARHFTLVSKWLPDRRPDLAAIGHVVRSLADATDRATQPEREDVLARERLAAAKDARAL
jgi:hypothetical protein